MKVFKGFLALTVLAASALATTTASAVQINGGISLAGLFSTDNADFSVATAFTSFSQIQVTSTTGDFGGIPTGVPGTVTMNAFSFSPFPAAGVTPLWEVAAGAGDPTYAAFDFLTLASKTQSQVGPVGSIQLIGTGTLYRFGFDPTPGVYILTANNAGGTFSFSSSNAATPTPEPGTLALLGLGLLGLGAARRTRR